MNETTKIEPTSQDIRIGGKYTKLPALPSIPRRRYIDDTFYNAEMKHIWRKNWLLVAHSSEFEKTGSYRALDIPIAPVLIVRGKDDALRAFLNSCPHRGAKVVATESGCSGILTCPYHSWSFDLKGNLIGLPSKEDFPGLILEDRSLKGIRCESWGDFVFVNLDNDAPPLLEWIEPLVRRHSERFKFDTPWRVVARESHEIACNWKLLVDAFRESYHVKTVHGKTAGPGLDAYRTYMEIYPNGLSTMYVPTASSFTDQEWKGLAVDAAADKSDTSKGKEIFPQLMFFPNVALPFQDSGIPLLTFWPINKQACRVDVTWLGPDWGSGQRPKTWNQVMAGFRVLVLEDLGILEAIQDSIEAAPDETIPLSTQECLMYELHAEIDRRIGAENIAEELRVPEPEFLRDYFSL